jgi:hypothetical protein
MSEVTRQYDAALAALLRSEYLRGKADGLAVAHRIRYWLTLRGKADGLAVAHRIRHWLTRQPDREWRREVREWADEAIARAERE